MAPPFRSDQVGSYLRPHELIDARVAASQGQIRREALREVEDAARPAVSMRWRGEHLDLLGRGAGTTPSAVVADPGTLAQAATVDIRAIIGAKLRARGRIYGEDSGFLKQHARAFRTCRSTPFGTCST